ncbi:histidine--tRNA ligase [Candidatus Woesearchaeota archaeon]|nr:histidine--tRNA ligase [Candidatus Woesearchaeota archaeon]
MKLMNARGTRDFGPEEKIVRQKIVDMLRKSFELYGFSPLETPIIERFDVLSAKYAGGAEIMKETFKFNDQGERELCLRYDLTVPLARFVGMNPKMKMPFKRYAIGRVFRDGPIKTGRYREFWQCDVDIIGSKSMLADAQCIQIAQKFFADIELDVNIEFNNRKLLDGMMESCGIPEEKRMDTILEVDKLRKTGIESVKNEMNKKGIEEDSVNKLMELISMQGTNAEKLDKVRSAMANQKLAEGLKEIEELLSYVDEKNIVLNLSLARGLSYYTGPVYEVFLKDKKLFSSSLAAGGRWDKMIGDFIGGREYPAVGISFGIEPITTVIGNNRKEEGIRTVTQLYVIPIQTTKKCIEIAEKTRTGGVNTDMDLMSRGVSKNLDYANKMGIPYVLIVGEEEIKQGKYKLKDMKSGDEKMVSVEEVCDMVK